MHTTGPVVGREFSDLLHRGLNIDSFFDAADRILAAVVPFDASCWLGLDPATLLPTSHFTREPDADLLMRIAANEFLEEDVNKFADLARAQRPVGLMSEATGGVPTVSKRYREILAPHGYADGDELRAVFFNSGAAWGCVVLHRRDGAFTEREAIVMAELGDRFLGEGIHRAVLITTLSTEPAADIPGLVLLGPDDTIESVTPAAARMLEEVVDITGGDRHLPLVVTSIAARVRGGHSGDWGEVATARLPRREGGWLVLYGSALDDGTSGRIAVMVYPETVPQVPRAVATAYTLSAREREVSSLVFQGCSTRDIAVQLNLSQYTVQDHLKKIFAKVGVRSRRELVARVFQEHYAPRLAPAAETAPPHPAPDRLPRSITAL